MNRSKSSALALIVATIGVLVAGWYHYGQTARLRDHGLLADGVVTRVQRGQPAVVVVGFETEDGQQLEVPVADYRWDPEPQVGGAARLLYDPQEPAASARDARSGLDLSGAWLRGVASVALLGVGAAVWHGRLRWLIEPREPEEPGEGRS